MWILLSLFQNIGAGWFAFFSSNELHIWAQILNVTIEVYLLIVFTLLYTFKAEYWDKCQTVYSWKCNRIMKCMRINLARIIPLEQTGIPMWKFNYAECNNWSLKFFLFMQQFYINMQELRHFKNVLTVTLIKHLVDIFNND